MKRISPDEFEKMLLNDEALRTRLMEITPVGKKIGSEVLKTLAAERGYDLELPESIVALPEEKLEQIVGGKFTAGQSKGGKLTVHGNAPQCPMGAPGERCVGKVIDRRMLGMGIEQQVCTNKCDRCGKEWTTVWEFT